MSDYPEAAVTAVIDGMECPPGTPVSQIVDRVLTELAVGGWLTMPIAGGTDDLERLTRQPVTTPHIPAEDEDGDPILWDCRDDIWRDGWEAGWAHARATFGTTLIAAVQVERYRAVTSLERLAAVADERDRAEAERDRAIADLVSACAEGGLL